MEYYKCNQLVEVTLPRKINFYFAKTVFFSLTVWSGSWASCEICMMLYAAVPQGLPVSLALILPFSCSGMHALQWRKLPWSSGNNSFWAWVPALGLPATSLSWIPPGKVSQTPWLVVYYQWWPEDHPASDRVIVTAMSAIFKNGLSYSVFQRRIWRWITAVILMENLGPGVSLPAPRNAGNIVTSLVAVSLASRHKGI